MTQHPASETLEQFTKDQGYDDVVQDYPTLRKEILRSIKHVWQRCVKLEGNYTALERILVYDKVHNPNAAHTARTTRRQALEAFTAVLDNYDNDVKDTAFSLIELAVRKLQSILHFYSAVLLITILEMDRRRACMDIYSYYRRRHVRRNEDLHIPVPTRHGAS